VGHFMSHMERSALAVSRYFASSDIAAGPVVSRRSIPRSRWVRAMGGRGGGDSGERVLQGSVGGALVLCREREAVSTQWALGWSINAGVFGLVQLALGPQFILPLFFS
jgi:hypothetical protein